MAASRSRRRSSSPSDSSPAPTPSPAPAGRRPCSERRMAANRANAKKSTGPRTQRGKNRSRFNAVVHGATASLSVLPGEDPATIKRFIDRVYEDLRPRGQAEAVLVDQYASIAWKLRRLGATEKAVVRQRFCRELDEWDTARDNIQWARGHKGMSAEDVAELDEEDRELSKRVPEPLTPWELVADELYDGKGPALRLIELETRLHGTLSNMVKQLKDLQTLRMAREKQERELDEADDAAADDAEAWKPGAWDVDEERWCDRVPEVEQVPAPAKVPAPATVRAPAPKGPEMRNKPIAAPVPEPPTERPQVEAAPEDAAAPANGDGAAIDVASHTGEPVKATEDDQPPMTPTNTDSEVEKPPSASV